MMLSGPNFALKSFLQVSITQYIFLHLIGARSKTRNQGWATISKVDIAEHLEIKKTAFSELVKNLTSRKLIEKRSKTGTEYRFTELFEEKISNKESWLLTCDSYTCWDELVGSENGQANIVTSSENEPVGSENGQASIYIYKHLNDSTDFSINGNEVTTHTTPSEAAPSSTKSTNAIWQLRADLSNRLLVAVQRDDFKEKGPIRNGMLNNIIALRDKIGEAEFFARIHFLMTDPFYAKNMGKLSYILSEVRSCQQISRKQTVSPNLNNNREYEE